MSETIATKDKSKTARDMVTLMVPVRLPVMALREADGRYSVFAPALPGCFSDAERLEDVAANAVEAAELWLEAEHDRRKDESLRTALGE